MANVKARQRIELETAIKYSSFDTLTDDGADEDVARFHDIASRLADLADGTKPEDQSWHDFTMCPLAEAEQLTSELRALVPCAMIPAGDTQALFMVSRVGQHWTEFEFIFGDAVPAFGPTVAVPKPMADRLLKRDRALRELFGA